MTLGAGTLAWVGEANPRWGLIHWPAIILLPLLVQVKGTEVKSSIQESEARLRDSRKGLDRFLAQRQKIQSSVRTLEESIQKITEQYGLSKEFLATLEMKQAFQITKEALAKSFPHLKGQERIDSLKKLESLLDQEGATAEALASLLPSTGVDHSTRERWGVMIGQLALGLRRASLYRQVETLALHDGLTGLWVRRHFQERLKEETARSLRRGSPLAVLMVDIDHFKQINDTYGHLVGDVVLREVAGILQRSVREMDMVCRYGGEEFAVALPEASAALGGAIAERVRTLIGGNPIPAYDEKVSVTVSVGVAFCGAEVRTAEELIERADGAMYLAKGRGRNQTVAA